MSHDPTKTARDNAPVDAVGPRLVELTRHPDSGIRRWALLRMAPDNDVDAASKQACGLEGLTDERRSVRAAAIELLSEIGVRDAHDELAPIVADPSLPHHLWRMAAELLVRQAGFDARAWLADNIDYLETDGTDDLWAALDSEHPDALRRHWREALDSEESESQRDQVLPRLAAVAEVDDLRLMLRHVADIDIESQYDAVDPWMSLVGADDLLVAHDEDLAAHLRERIATFADASADAAQLAFHGVPWTAIVAKIASADYRGAIADCLELGDDSDQTSPCFAELELWSRAMLAALGGLTAPGHIHAAMAVALMLAQCRRRAISACLGNLDPYRTLMLCTACSVYDRSALNDVALEAWHADAATRSRVTDTLVDRLVDQLDWMQVGPAQQLLELFFAEGAREYGEVISAGLLRVMETSIEDEFREWASHRLSAFPRGLKHLAESRLAGDYDGKSQLLDVLGCVHEDWVAPLIVAHLDLLLADGLEKPVMDTLENVGNPSVLGALIGIWHPGEHNTARTIQLLANLAGREHKLAPELLRDAEAAAARGVAQEDSVGQLDRLVHWMHDEVDAPLRLSLQCCRCGRVYNYGSVQAVVSPRQFHAYANDDRQTSWDGVLLYQVINCKHCGAEDDYRLTHTAQTRLMALMGSTLLRGNDGAANAGIRVGEARLADGTVIERASHGLTRLRHHVQTKPTSALDWRRLGNFCSRIGHDQEAVQAWSTAAELDDGEVESLVCVAEHHRKAGATDQARTWYTDALARVPRTRRSAEDRFECVDLALRGLLAGVEATENHLWITATWAERVKGETMPGRLQHGAIDLRTVRQWERLTEFLCSPIIDSIAVADSVAEPDRGALYDRIEAAGDSDINTRTVVRTTPKIGRNDPCPCGSGKKYKKCCR